MRPPTPPPDRRRNAWRDDLAAEDLRGRVVAARYVKGDEAQVIAPIASVVGQPREAASLTTQALYGERVRVFEVEAGWAWVQLARDGYVGYVREDTLTRDPVAATHRVAARATFVFPAADLKRPVVMMLPFGAEVAVAEEDGAYSRLVRGGHVFSGHLAPLATCEPDFVAVAERLLGVPYLWGGKTPLGCDCSGLVQLALQAAGIPAPRDSDMQAAELGEPLAIADDLPDLQRGDLVCWAGHIGIMRDAITLLHANAHHMMVASEPLAQAVRRIAAAGAPPVGLRRLASLSS